MTYVEMPVWLVILICICLLLSLIGLTINDLLAKILCELLKGKEKREALTIDEYAEKNYQKKLKRR